MKRLLFPLLLATAALAEVPADTLVTKLAERDTPQKKFLRENPGAIETVRLEHAVHYRKANGENVAIFASGLNRTDNAGQIVPVDPQLWETDAGYRETGTPVTVRIVSGRSSDDIEMYDAVTGKVVTISSPKLTRTGDWTFLVSKWALLDWTLEVTPSGWNLTSQQIAAARGSYTYQLPLASSGADPQPDPATGDLVDGSFRLTRAVMVGADDSRTACSAWTRASKSIAFTCDDSTLAPAAFPYYIDPTANFTVATDDAILQWKVLSTWPPPAGGPATEVLDAGYVTQRIDYTLSGGYYFYDNWAGRFDTSSLPDDATVTAATLNFYVYQTTYTNGPYNFRASPLPAYGVALVTAAVNKLVFPPLVPGLRVWKWSKPAGSLNARTGGWA